MATTPAGGWSVQIGRVLGIPIRIHFTFILIVVWVVAQAVRFGGNAALAVLGILLLFACVVLHELGHATVARRFGVRTREIVLYPIGGVARLENIPSGIAELFVALAGPAVSAVVAAVLLIVVVRFELFPTEESFNVGSLSDLPIVLMVANAVLFFFNLLPAFPMDGGRVLRALLSFVVPEDRATRIAATIGQGMAVLIAAVGLLSGLWWFLLIALVVFLGATHEAAFTERRVVVQGHSAREAMITRFETLAPQDSLGQAAALLLDSHQRDFPILDAWRRVVGVLSRSNLLDALNRHGASAAVLDVMDREIIRVRPESSLDQILPLLQMNPGKPALVLDGPDLVGMITMDNLAEFVEVIRRTRDRG